MESVQEKMNTIRAILDMRKQFVKLPVKIGSHKLSLNVFSVSRSVDVIRAGLVQCKIPLASDNCDADAAAGYQLFERSRGVERALKRDQNIFSLVLGWEVTHEYELVIKKCRRSSVIQNSMIRNSRYGASLFRLGKEKAAATANCMLVESGEIHMYEKMEDSAYECDSSDKSLIESANSIETFLDRILTNQRVLSKQTRQLKKMDKSIAQHVKSVKKIIKKENRNLQRKALPTQPNPKSSSDKPMAVQYLQPIFF
jgi:hypothetical protein